MIEKIIAESNSGGHQSNNSGVEELALSPQPSARWSGGKSPRYRKESEREQPQQQQHQQQQKQKQVRIALGNEALQQLPQQSKEFEEEPLGRAGGGGFSGLGRQRSNTQDLRKVKSLSDAAGWSQVRQENRTSRVIPTGGGSLIGIRGAGTRLIESASSPQLNSTGEGEGDGGGNKVYLGGGERQERRSRGWRNSVVVRRDVSELLEDVNSKKATIGGDPLAGSNNGSNQSKPRSTENGQSSSGGPNDNTAAGPSNAVTSFFYSAIPAAAVVEEEPRKLATKPHLDPIGVKGGLPEEAMVRGSGVWQFKRLSTAPSLMRHHAYSDGPSPTTDTLTRPTAFSTSPTTPATPTTPTSTTPTTPVIATPSPTDLLTTTTTTSSPPDPTSISTSPTSTSLSTLDESPFEEKGGGDSVSREDRQARRNFRKCMVFDMEKHTSNFVLRPKALPAFEDSVDDPRRKNSEDDNHHHNNHNNTSVLLKLMNDKTNTIPVDPKELVLDREKLNKFFAVHSQAKQANEDSEEDSNEDDDEDSASDSDSNSDDSSDDESDDESDSDVEGKRQEPASPYDWSHYDVNAVIKAQTICRGWLARQCYKKYGIYVPSFQLFQMQY